MVDMRISVIFRVLALLVLMAVVTMPVSGAIGNDRSIRVKGVFVMVDEASLLERIKSISVRNPGRQEFIDRTYEMLNHEQYISSSSIRYSWPNDVVIEITEITPAAIVNTSELLLNDCSRVPMASGRAPINLVGVNTENPLLEENQCRRILGLLPIISAMPVSEITILGNGDYVLAIANRQLLVGKDDFLRSINRIRKVAQSMYSGRLDADYVDMRYASGMAVRKVSVL